MSDRPTPETDRRIIQQQPRMCGCHYKEEIVFASLARRLERERDEAREKLWDALNQYGYAKQDAFDARKERDTLAEAFEAAKAFIESHVADPDITEEMARNYEAYKSSLAPIKQ